MFQFNHQRNYSGPLENRLEAQGGTTFALCVPSRKTVDGLLEFEDPRILMDFGRAKCHPTENYNKRTGTGIAELRSQPKSFLLLSVVLEDKNRYYTLRADDGVIVHLKGNLNSDRLYFQQVL